MTEDELLHGITDALNVGGWLWYHVRRSDLSGQMGTPGLPDIIAVHPTREAAIAWELKAERGRYMPGQVEWLDAFGLAGVDARTVTPSTYDEAWRWLVGPRLSLVK